MEQAIGEGAMAGFGRGFASEGGTGGRSAASAHAASAASDARAAAQAAPAAGADARQVPLFFLGSGEKGLVVKVRGRGDLQRHLETLGFVEGAEVTAVSSVAGDLIVEVKGAQVAVSRQAASHVLVAPAR